MFLMIIITLKFLSFYYKGYMKRNFNVIWTISHKKRLHLGAAFSYAISVFLYTGRARNLSELMHILPAAALP